MWHSLSAPMLTFIYPQVLGVPRVHVVPPVASDRLTGELVVVAREGPAGALYTAKSSLTYLTEVFSADRATVWGMRAGRIRDS
jgi:hypothetical protein